MDPTEDPLHAAPYLVQCCGGLEFELALRPAAHHITSDCSADFLKTQRGLAQRLDFNVNLFTFKYVKMPFLDILMKFRQICKMILQKKDFLRL